MNGVVSGICKIYIEKESVEYATGFMVRDGLILTNAHAVYLATKIGAVIVTNDQHIYTECTVVKYSHAMDLALLSCDITGISLQLSDEPINVADPVWYINYTHRLHTTIFDRSMVKGRILGFVQTEYTNIILGIAMNVYIPVKPGDSGSPIFNPYGQVVGMVFQKTSDGNTQVIPSAVIKKFMNMYDRGADEVYYYEYNLDHNTGFEVPEYGLSLDLENNIGPWLNTSEKVLMPIGLTFFYYFDNGMNFSILQGGKKVSLVSESRVHPFKNYYQIPGITYEFSRFNISQMYSEISTKEDPIHIIYLFWTKKFPIYVTSEGNIVEFINNQHPHEIVNQLKEGLEYTIQLEGGKVFLQKFIKCIKDPRSIFTCAVDY